MDSEGPGDLESSPYGPNQAVENQEHLTESSDRKRSETVNNSATGNLEFPLPRPTLVPDSSDFSDEALLVDERDRPTYVPDGIPTAGSQNIAPDARTEYTAITTASSAVDRIKLPPFYASLKLAPIALFYGLGSGIMGPVMIELLKARVCTMKLGYSQDVCSSLTDGHHQLENEKVLAVTSHYTFFLRLAENLPCVFIALFTGSWSDHFGRKLPMLIPFIAMFVSAGPLIILSYIPAHPAFLLVVPLIPAMFGGFLISLAAMLSYLGDYSGPETLPIDLAIFDGTFSFSMNIGALVGGVLFGMYGFPYPFMLYTFLLLMTILYTTFAIRDRRVLVREFNRTNLLALLSTNSFKENRLMLTKERLGNTKIHILVLLGCLTLSALCMTGAGSINQLFFESSPLNWSVKHYTTFSALTGIITGLLIMAAVPVLKRIFAVRDTMMAIIGIISAILSLSIFTAANVNWKAICGACVGALAALQFVAVRSLLSNLVDEDERGKMMSVIASLQAIIPILGSLIFTSAFSATVSWWPGFTYALAGLLSVIALGGLCFVDADRRKNEYRTVAEGAYAKLDNM